MTRSGGGLRCNVALLGQSGALASDKIPIFRGWLVLQANNARRKVRAKSTLGQFLKSCNLCATFVVAAFLCKKKRADPETGGQPFDEGAALRSALLYGSRHAQGNCDAIVVANIE